MLYYALYNICITIYKITNIMHYTIYNIMYYIKYIVMHRIIYYIMQRHGHRQSYSPTSKAFGPQSPRAAGAMLYNAI